MDNLIGDLLDAGRIETGTLSVAPEPSEVAALVDQARGTFVSGGGRHTVRIDLPPGLPRVMADRQRLIQVLNNLLANAARHSPESAPYPDRGGARGAACGGLGLRRGPGHRAGPSRPAVPQVHRRRGPGGRPRQRGWDSPSARAWSRPMVGRIRAESGGVGLGARFTFTIPVAAESGAGPRPGPPRRAGPRTGRGAHPGGRRRPGDAAPSPRHVGGGGLRPAGHRRPPGAAAHCPGREAPAGPARPDAARDRRPSS